MNKEQARPLVTFALFAYNQEKYVREAVKSALDQDYPNLEIILSDDCSTDATFEIISATVAEYAGTHDVVLNRNPVNVGLTRHVNEVIAKAKGEIVVMAAGDDISLPARVSKTVAMLDADPDATFASFTDTIIDKDGKVVGESSEGKPVSVRKVTLDRYLAGGAPFLSGASRGFRKKLFETFGELNPACPTEDTPTVLRGLMAGHALLSSEGGILYRRHGSNLSSPSSLHSMAFEEIKKQYLRDAEQALASGLISEKTKRRVQAWAEKNHRRRELSSEFHRTSGRLKFVLFRLLPSRDFKLREKVGMLWRTI